jgi:nicotinamide mononucleotide adenylyltransferase
MAYDTLKSKFAERFASEQSVRKADVARSEYDAKNEVETLKEEFASLRKSLTEQSNEIVKAQTIEVPDFDVNEMSWGDIHNVIAKFEE